ncbi:hypothetical protein FB567DRAFT_582721 [Paraphoma chrysanthemicola]|uniref:Uncharacterized protein n=1 Tax=Paraphoma chrysanthemicola TaxID=798071 RepID=A0A8K0QXP9_9PLEO|nr:hypothetical protein FB567DRAFT_582721 [Paraphoma chrysanthemicola]
MSDQTSSTRGAARSTTQKPSVDEISSGPLSLPRTRPSAPGRLATGELEADSELRYVDISRLETMAKVSKTHAKDFATMSNGVAMLQELVDKMPNGTAKLNLNKELKRLQPLTAKHSNYKYREATRTQAFLDSLTARGGRAGRPQLGTLLRTLNDQDRGTPLEMSLSALCKVELGHATKADDQPKPQSEGAPVTTAKPPKLNDGSKLSKPMETNKPTLPSQPSKLSTSSEPSKPRRPSKPAGLLGMLSTTSTTQPRIRMKTQAQMDASAAKAKELSIDGLFKDPHTAGPVASKAGKDILKSGKEDVARDQDADKNIQDVTPVQKVDTKQEIETSVNKDMPEQPITEVEMKDGDETVQVQEPQRDGSVNPSIYSSNQNAEQEAPPPANASNTGKDTVDEANKARYQASTNDPAPTKETKEATEVIHTIHAEDDLTKHGHDEMSASAKLSSSPTANSRFKEAQPAKQPRKPMRDSAIDSSPEAQNHESNTSKRKSQETVSRDGTSSDTTSTEPKRIGRKNFRRAGQPGVAIRRKISRAQRDAVSEDEEDSDESEDEPVAKEPAKKTPGNKTSKATPQSAKKKPKSDEFVVDNDEDAEDQQSAQGKGEPTSATKPHQPKKSKENEENDNLNSQGIDLTNIVYGSRRKHTGGGSTPRKHILQSAPDSGSKRKRSDIDDETSQQKRRALEWRYIARPKTRLPAPMVDTMEIDSGTTLLLAAPAEPLTWPTLAVPRISPADATYLGDDELWMHQV